MNIKVILSSAASREIKESFRWYEERQPGLGARFLYSIDKHIELIIRNPEGYPQKVKPYREIVLRKFPFILIYEFDKDAQLILILSVFHTKRDPSMKY